MKYLLLGLIKLYQLTFSRLLPENTCKFYPTCSHYGFEAIQVHGALKGTALAAWRILRCNPFSDGGFDYVPPKKPGTLRSNIIYIFSFLVIILLVFVVFFVVL